jgi:tRNA(fMet)-specific endonuclease VapC
MDSNASKITGKIYNELKENGKMLDIADQFIAGIVISNNETLITRNTKHFSRIRRLKSEAW